MSDDRWIIVPGWAKFQHYADRDPVWIKVYTELEHRDEWCRLTLAERGLLVCIWIEYALRRGQIRTSDIPRYVLQKVPQRSLESLQTAGFIEVVASKPLALARARARSREEEEEKETPKPPLKEKRRRATGWREVRGSHGSSLIPDPFGTDRAPVR